MIARRDTLDHALTDIETHALAGATTIVVNRQWWGTLSASEQEGYRRRAGRSGVELRADAAMSRHFVEVRGRDDGPPLSTERPM